MAADNALHDALKQLSTDLRVLIDLSMHETEESWVKMIEIVKKELSEERLIGKKGKAVSSASLHEALISDIYDHLGLLVRNLRASQERLRRLATRDLLTGLYNRNFFNETIARDIRKAERLGESLSFIVIDVDGFKQINDTYGHLHGDGVLRECSRILKESVRKSDFLCRFGGDEFVIVTPMPDCGRNSALFERINGKVEEWNNSYSSFDYRLSLSIGCAVWTSGRDVVDVLAEADRNMYKQKKKKKQPLKSRQSER